MNNIQQRPENLDTSIHNIDTGRKPIRCLSSYMMTGLMTFRNPYGNEDQAQTWNNLKSLIPLKKVLVEIALPLVTVIALVEKIVYTTLWTLSLFLYPITKKPKEFMAKMVQSSNFSIVWSLFALPCNFIFTDAPTHESTMRYGINQVFGCKLFERAEDTSYVNDKWQRSKDLNVTDQEVQHDATAVTLIIDDVFTEEIYGDDLEAKIGEFLDSDVNMILDVLEQTIRLYASGKHKAEPIPGFFTEATARGIRQIRTSEENIDHGQQIKGLAFEESQKGRLAKEIFQKANTALGEKYPNL